MIYHSFLVFILWLCIFVLCILIVGMLVLVISYRGIFLLISRYYSQFIVLFFGIGLEWDWLNMGWFMDFGDE